LPGSRAGRGSSSSSASSACEHARLLGLGLGGLDHLGHELLLAQLGLALGQLSLSRDHFALRAGLRQRAGLRGLGLGLVDLGLVLGLDDRGLALVLGLLALGLLLGLGRRLIGLGLGDLGLALDGGVVGRGHRVDVPRAHVVDRLDLQRVDDQTHLDHLRLGAVEDLGGQLLALGDDLLDGHRSDDRAQMAGEDPPRQHGHLILVRQEALGGVDDALGIVADLERDHRLCLERDPLLGHALLGDLGLPHGQGEELACRINGTTNAP
jgi:hypothetical protein